MGAPTPGRGPSPGSRADTAHLHPTDAWRVRVRRAAVRDAGGRPQLRQQHSAADHLPAGRLRADRHAPVPSQSRWHRGAQHRHGGWIRRRTRPVVDHPGEHRGHAAHRPRMRARRRGACDAQHPGRRHRARRTTGAAGEARPRAHRPHQTILRFSIRAVPRLDLAAPAAVAARLAAAARAARAAARGGHRRHRAVHPPGRRRGMGRTARVPRRRLAAAGCVGRVRARPRLAGQDLPIAGRAPAHLRFRQRAGRRRRAATRTARGVDRGGARPRRTLRPEDRGQEVLPASGSEHRARCLNGLALYGSGEPW